ncbi:C45 family peptidase [Ostreiculturibacter nitratireducens]|uniref:C45 family peptidase n=1 Tax=Ostreiculturibacter nitratireducens TaxID=3075226 RepID=UPI0031B635AE
MTEFAPELAQPLLLSGDARARGRGQAAEGDADRVRAATVGRVETARAEGMIDSAAEDYLARQRAFHAEHDPEGMAELSGIAEGFGLSEDDLFVHLHLGTLRDLKSGAKLDGDGCSAWAAPEGPDGPIVAKNRDYSGLHLGIQRVTLHSGPDVTTGAMLCVGSLGSPAAYSSGMNARGLMLADTQVAVRTHRVGWLRYFLMTRILASCGTVAEALALIASRPHAGGGTLIMADASGDTAAVELGAAGAGLTRGGIVWRTNHFVLPDRADDTLFPDGDRIAGNSRERFAYLERSLPGLSPVIPDATKLMCTHRDSGPAAAPLCQHGETEASQTLSTAIYSCRFGSLTFSQGNPCAGKWQTYRMPS